MKKVLFLFGLFTVSLFAKEIIDGYIKEPFLELVKDEESFYIKKNDRTPIGIRSHYILDYS